MESNPSQPGQSTFGPIIVKMFIWVAKHKKRPIPFVNFITIVNLTYCNFMTPLLSTHKQNYERTRGNTIHTTQHNTHILYVMYRLLPQVVFCVSWSTLIISGKEAKQSRSINLNGIESNRMKLNISIHTLALEFPSISTSWNEQLIWLEGSSYFLVLVLLSCFTKHSIWNGRCKCGSYFIAGGASLRICFPDFQELGVDHIPSFYDFIHQSSIMISQH